MPRRGKVVKRIAPPDVRYHSEKITRLVNRIMIDGKKSKAERIVYTALDIIKERVERDPLEVFEEAIKNTTPLLAVKPRRIGGATYQVPVEVPPERGLFLAMRWLVTTARAHKGKPMAERLAAEIMDASRSEGITVKKRIDTHKMAEANRAFAHYRW
ncbi:MAG: 30S ribosomal protein S7 [Dehalococcoidia bacterium]|nr:30S ribosomal protein S7 [Chloroflexota bacterium]MBT9160022.1 30S ribosomal protein S7 [Chloroflexota bacterium]MBT9161619.1 30S ribosomal protein S7 [Chloroflexota bacterium]